MNLFDYIINLIEAVIVITAFILWDSKQQCSILRIIVSVFIIFLTITAVNYLSVYDGIISILYIVIFSLVRNYLVQSYLLDSLFVSSYVLLLMYISNYIVDIIYMFVTNTTSIWLDSPYFFIDIIFSKILCVVFVLISVLFRRRYCKYDVSDSLKTIFLLIDIIGILFLSIIGYWIYVPVSQVDMLFIRLLSMLLIILFLFVVLMGINFHLYSSFLTASMMKSNNQMINRQQMLGYSLAKDFIQIRHDLLHLMNWVTKDKVSSNLANGELDLIKIRNRLDNCHIFTSNCKELEIALNTYFRYIEIRDIKVIQVFESDLPGTEQERLDFFGAIFQTMLILINKESSIYISLQEDRDSFYLYFKVMNPDSCNINFQVSHLENSSGINDYLVRNHGNLRIEKGENLSLFVSLSKEGGSDA